MSAVKDAKKAENAGEASSKLDTEAETPKPLKPVPKIVKKEKVDTEAGTPKPLKPVTKIVKKTPTVKKEVPQLQEGKVDTGAGTPKPLKRVIKIVKKVVRKKKPNEADKGEVSDRKKDAEKLQGGIKDVKQSTEDTTQVEKKLQGENKGVKQSIEDATQAEKKLQGENEDVKQSTEDTSKERSANDLKQPDPHTEKKEDTVPKEKQQSDKKNEGKLSRKQRRNRQRRAFKELKASKLKDQEKELDAQKGNKEKNVSKEEHQKDQKNEKNSTHSQKQNLQKRKGQNDQKKEEEPNSQKRRREESESKEKQNDQGNKELGGLIFMCNGKTKPDCYRYGVMGVPHSKKELVLGIKPGLTLFLYDFDLRLMYGIYKASSAGGFKLEPPAFGGGFPVQVRFKVDKDCLPLPESVFKNAIKDNYVGDKFKTELTVVQVKKLKELFRPVEHHQSNAQPLLHAPLLTPFAPSIPVEHHQSNAQPLLHAPFLTPLAPSVPVLRTGDRKEPQLPVHGEKLPGSSYSFDESRRYYMPPPEHQRESLLKHPASTQGNTAAKQKEPAYGDQLFLSEKEYRTYGLRQQGRRSSPPPTTAPISGSSSHSVQTPYYPYHSSSVSDRYLAIDPYAPYPRRETHATDPSYAGRGVNSYSQPIKSVEGQGLYSTYASHALSDYNQKNYPGLRAEQDSSAVSSRYAFAGPTFNRS